MAKASKKPVDIDPSKPLKSAAQEQFCINIATGMQQGPAYRAVPGYSGKTADISASKLIRIANVASRIAYLRDKMAEKAVVDVARVVREIARIGLFDPAELFLPNGKLRSIHDMPQDARRAIAGIEIKTSAKGKSTITKIKMASKSPSHDQLMKHFGGYERDNDQKNKGWDDYLAWLNSK